MNRFLTLSAICHLLLLTAWSFSFFGLLGKEKDLPQGAFSVSLNNLGVVGGPPARKSPQPKILVPEPGQKGEVSQRSITEPSGATGAEAGAETRLGSPNGVEVGLRERYLFELRQAIDQEKRYPAAAREMRQEGRVEVEFQIRADGRFEALRLAALSPYERLNTAALKLIESIGEFRPLPAELGAGPLIVRLPIDYILR